MREHLLLFMLFCMSMSVSAQSLKGHITLSDTLSGRYATVSIPALGETTLANEYGDWRFHSLPAGTYDVEFSRINYAKQHATIEIKEKQTAELDINMELQPYDLPMAYALPDGQDPAAFILGKMWEQSDKNSQALSYDATVAFTFSSYNCDILDCFLSPFQKRLFKFVSKTMGFKAIVNIIMKNTEPVVTTEQSQSFRNGKLTCNGCRIANSNVELTDSEREFFFKDDVLNGNLFNKIYGPKMPWGRKNKMHKKFRYVGSYLEDGNYIDVLRNGAYTIHIVEDDWQIIKIRKAEFMDVSNTICQKIDGIYLPTSISTRTEYGTMPPEQVKTLAEVAKQIVEGVQKPTYEGKDVQMSEKTSKRLKKMYPMLERLEKKGEGIPVSMGISYSIRYR